MPDAPAPDDNLRREAARLAFAAIRFEEKLSHLLGSSSPPGQPVLGIDTYSFTPSWRQIPRAEVESFLAALPSPALMSPTLTRGMIALTLLNELTGDRRKWGEKTLSNFTAVFDQACSHLSLAGKSRFLLEFYEESHVFTHAAVRLWTQQFAVQTGWTLDSLKNDPRADARILLRRSDGMWSTGRKPMP